MRLSSARRGSARLGVAPPDRELGIRADQSGRSVVRRKTDEERFKLANCEPRRVGARHR